MLELHFLGSARHEASLKRANSWFNCKQHWRICINAFVPRYPGDWIPFQTEETHSNSVKIEFFSRTTAVFCYNNIYTCCWSLTARQQRKQEWETWCAVCTGMPDYFFCSAFCRACCKAKANQVFFKKLSNSYSVDPKVKNMSFRTAGYIPHRLTWGAGFKRFLS